MKTDTPDLAGLVEALGALRAEVARLGDRIAALEAGRAPGPAAEPARAAPTARPEPLREETVVAIGAAVAAFLGKRAHVRQIRLVGSAAWGQQGRVTIQASHQLPARD